MSWQAKREEMVPQGNIRRVPIVARSEVDGEARTEIVGEGWGLTTSLALDRARLMAAAPKMRAALAAFGAEPITRRRVAVLATLFADAIAAADRGEP